MCYEDTNYIRHWVTVVYQYQPYPLDVADVNRDGNEVRQT